jgi:hypothetical protein
MSGGGFLPDDQIRRAFPSLRKRSQEYELKSYALATALREALIKFLGCSPEAVRFVPVLSEPEAGKIYWASGALKIGDDSFWHFGLVLDFGLTRLLFHFLLKGKPDGSFSMKPSTADAPTFGVAGPSGDFGPILDWVFNSVKDYLESGLDRFLSQTSSKPIGFVTEMS